MDIVKQPSHYTWHPSGVECKTIAQEFCYNLGCALKYIWRADHKGNAVQDLKKAIEYLENEIRRREGGNETQGLMWICAYCGHQNEGSRTTCFGCGKRYNEQAS